MWWTISYCDYQLWKCSSNVDKVVVVGHLVPANVGRVCRLTVEEETNAATFNLAIQVRSRWELRIPPGQPAGSRWWRGRGWWRLPGERRTSVSGGGRGRGTPPEKKTFGFVKNKRHHHCHCNCFKLGRLWLEGCQRLIRSAVLQYWLWRECT